MNKFRLFEKAHELGKKHCRQGAGIAKCPAYGNYPEGMAKRLQAAWKDGWQQEQEIPQIRGYDITQVWVDEALIAERRIPDESDN